MCNILKNIQAKITYRRGLILITLFLLTLIIECIPQEAEARRSGGGLFGRRRPQGMVRRVNRNRGVVRRNNNGVRRVVRNNFNNDIFGLDLEPVNLLSSQAINPFGALHTLEGFNNIATDGSGRFFVVNNGLNGLELQSELLRNGSSFFGAVNPFTGTFNPTVPSEVFSQIEFLNALGTLGTNCRGRRCRLQ